MCWKDRLLTSVNIHHTHMVVKVYSIHSTPALESKYTVHTPGQILHSGKVPAYIAEKKGVKSKLTQLQLKVAESKGACT